ncbi:hypothetical protein PC121_g16412 [Phytophthora cactorum]|nr:hypothetical protein PC121_g16412 [Phytophthora cactorum]KAG4049035.1 hypothetical protein PC123_g15666 [Phytophthora cactorum]
MQQRALYLDFLDQVPIFSTLSSYEKMTVADALRVQFVGAGDVILTEGSRGDDFYIIAGGEVKCTRGGEEVSARLGAGDFFGELALIHDDVRQATVTAMRKTKLLVLDRATFKRLLGPMQEHLRKRADLYELYMNTPRITEQN